MKRKIIYIVAGLMVVGFIGLGVIVSVQGSRESEDSKLLQEAIRSEHIGADLSSGKLEYTNECYPSGEQPRSNCPVYTISISKEECLRLAKKLGSREVMTHAECGPAYKDIKFQGNSITLSVSDDPAGNYSLSALKVK